MKYLVFQNLLNCTRFIRDYKNRNEKHNKYLAKKRQSGTSTTFSPGTSSFCLTITLNRPDDGSVETKHVALSVFLTIK
jgi:hypothetical protein